MADRYPEHDGRDGSRGRFSRSERWGDDDDWRRRSRQGGRFGSQEEDDGDRRGYGGYGGAYGQGMSGDYAGGYERSRRDADDETERGQSFGARHRDRDDWDRGYGLQGSGYGRQGQSQYAGAGRMGQGGYGYDQGYRQQGIAGFGAYEEGGSFGQGRPGMGGQGYSQNEDRSGYTTFGQSSGYGSEQSGGYLTRGGRAQWGRHSGRGPKNYTRSDDRIRDDINDRLTDDPHLDATEIEVKVTNCEVTLSGTVDSREAKRRAEDCADFVSGVKHVQNNLRVQAQDQRSSGENETSRTGKKTKTGGGDEDRLQ
jgi:osmotically-inducible protein OsmY